MVAIAFEIEITALRRTYLCATHRCVKMELGACELDSLDDTESAAFARRVQRAA
jgi:hypothetical protein